MAAFSRLAPWCPINSKKNRAIRLPGALLSLSFLVPAEFDAKTAKDR
jgi:hypothetical protein